MVLNKGEWHLLPIIYCLSNGYPGPPVLIGYSSYSEEINILWVWVGCRCYWTPVLKMGVKNLN